MGRAIVRWFKRLIGIGTALVAVFFLLRAGKHRDKQVQLERQVEDAQEQAGVNVTAAKAERHKAAAAKRRAEAALEEARARRTKLKENGNEDLATRVDAFNRRLRK